MPLLFVPLPSVLQISALLLTTQVIHPLSSHYSYWILPRKFSPSFAFPHTLSPSDYFCSIYRVGLAAPILMPLIHLPSAFRCFFFSIPSLL